MSVYKPPKSSLWLYDFRWKGRRFHGPTGQKTRRAAETVERKLRLDAAEGRLGEAAQLSLDDAVGKYWLEVGQHRGDHVDTWRRLKELLTLIPKSTVLADIDTTVVSAAIQRRRGMAYKKSRKKGAKAYPPSNGTVNRNVIQTLRPVLRRAAIHWGAKGLPAIDWGELKLPEPRETVRVYSRAEMEAWDRECGPTAALALRLLLIYGLRMGELFFPLTAFQPDGPRLSWMKGRKLDVPHTVPLLEADAREIAARLARAEKAELDTIWFVEVKGAKGKIVLEPLSYYALQGRLNKAAERAGIAGGRVIHGARHHAGTTAMRASGGSAKVTQRLLGHLDPRSTARYVHAMDADVLAMLENVELSRNSPEVPKPKKRQTKAR